MDRVSFFKSKKDLKINVDKFSKENNILYVTGLSGSGKTTETNKLSEIYGATIFGIDNLGGYYYEYKDSNDLIHSLTECFLKKHKEVDDLIRKGEYVFLKFNDVERYIVLIESI